ncbi:MAG TPA: D-aminoacylase [Ignavibacteriales bacterium]|nr:D-aminoacylase [Ignavibacteriales bacterium]
MKTISRREFLKDSAAFGIAAAGLNLPAFSLKNQFDLVIKNGSVIDGTGRREFKADLGIKNGRITAIGKLSHASADKVIDARGLKVSPGFIDIHSHTDIQLLVNPRAESKIRQGITTEAGGQCGGSMAPLGGMNVDLDKSLQRIKDNLNIDVTWRTFPEFMDYFSSQKFSINLVMMAGLGSIRSFAMGEGNRRATEDEMNVMLSKIQEACHAGIVGVSSGLEYLPGSFSDSEELIRLCKAVPKAQRIYATHMRNEDKTVIEALDEAIRIAQASDARLQVSHLKACGKSNWSKTDELLLMLEKAADSGLDINADRYTYTAYATSLDMFFPLWAREGGDKFFLGRLSDKNQLGRMKESVEMKVSELNGAWNGILIAGTPKPEYRHYQGKTVQNIADEMNMSAFDAAVRVILETENLTDMVGFAMDEPNTEKILSHPLVMIGSDSSVHSPEPPLGNKIAHPRGYGTFPRAIAHYVRERKICPLETMIKKMTSMSAKKLGLNDRGAIEKGKIADITIFDFNKIQDNAEYSNPHQYPEGIPYVIINGIPVIEQGIHTQSYPGQLLRG